MRDREDWFEHLIENHALCCAAEGKSKKTIEFYESNLKRFARYVRVSKLADGIDDIGPAEVRRYVRHLQEEVTRWQSSPYIRDDKRLSAHSIQASVRAIKAFWSWLCAEDYIEGNPMVRLKLPKVPHKVIATFDMEHIKRMLHALDLGRPAGFRDYSIILVLLDTGIRLGELTGLTLDNVDFEHFFFLVRGKGDKERVVPFGGQVRRVLRRYVDRFRPEPAYPRVNELFLTSTGLPLQPHSVQSMVRRLGRQAGITDVRCSPHTFRHTFAKQYLMNGGDAFSLQKILGHSSLEVVRTYVNLAFKDVAEQHRKASPVDTMSLSPRRGRGRRPIGM